MKTFWRVGLNFALVCIVLASLLAYTGVIPTRAFSASHADWVGHALGFGTMAFFLDGFLGHRSLFAIRGLTWIKTGPALVLAIAGIDEIAQRLSPIRSSTLGDFVADVIGVSAGAFLAGCLTRYVASRLRAYVNQ